MTHQLVAMQGFRVVKVLTKPLTFKAATKRLKAQVKLLVRRQQPWYSVAIRRVPEGN